MTTVDTAVATLPPSPDPQAIIKHLTQAYVALAEKGEYLEGMKTAVPGLGKQFGVKVPILRQLAKGLLRTYREVPETMKATAIQSWNLPEREHKLMALFILAGLKDMPPEERWSIGVQFLPDVTNWEVCDQLCMALLGQALVEDPKFMDTLESWVLEENLWVRRVTLVAPVYLRRAKHPPDVARELDCRTLAICKSLLEDQEKYIRKAADWSIRAVIARHYDLASDWMMEQAEVIQSRTARSTLKLASKKLRQPDREALLARLEN
jgi:3-methyladenine DNA glycosylase AlkD